MKKLTAPITKTRTTAMQITTAVILSDSFLGSAGFWGLMGSALGGAALKFSLHKSPLQQQK